MTVSKEFCDKCQECQANAINDLKDLINAKFETWKAEIDGLKRNFLIGFAIVGIAISLVEVALKFA